MGLAKKASSFLDGLRRHRHHGRKVEKLSEPGVKPVLGERAGEAVATPRHQLRSSPAAAGATGSAPPMTGHMAQEPVLTHMANNATAQNSVKRSAVDRMQPIHVAEDSVDEIYEEEGEQSDEDDESDDEVEQSVAEDMQKLEESFQGISQKYRLINRIGEGTFSTVYKAEQLSHDGDEDEDTDTLIEKIDPETGSTKRQKLSSSSSSTRQIVTKPRRKPQYVALKKIYVTSSPHRIANELELLHRLRDAPHICPLLTAFRHLDQVVAVLPYFRHLDFRLYYRDFIVNDMRHYFRSLFSGLHSVHKAGILHRDIKPTNFLYDHTKRQGVLVDFGLAEKQGTDWQPCLCQEKSEKRRGKFMNSFAVQALQEQEVMESVGYPKHDPRPSRRANRAGTRGFRAPEVLLKCTSQTTKIDIWSAGVILLTLLARRFPFFNSADDVDAMIEMSSIFGKRKMKFAAAMHGSVFETSIETIGDKGFTLEKIIIWASCREKEQGPLRAGEAQAVNFLEGLLELDPHKRFSAKEALLHEFFAAPVEDEVERAEREQQEEAEEEADEEARRTD